MTAFLPPGYQSLPGQYFKPTEGQHVVRPLGEALVGVFFWANADGGKPKKLVRRFVSDFTPEELAEAAIDKDGRKERPREFWAIPVWNYQAGIVQIWDVRQPVISRLLNLIANHGDPLDYDVLVDQKAVVTGVLPGPKGPLPKEALEAWQEIENGNFDLEALFRGDDPFDPQPINISLDELDGLNPEDVYRDEEAE